MVVYLSYVFDWSMVRAASAGGMEESTVAFVIIEGMWWIAIHGGR
jgi:hypothetical protein